MKQFLVKYIAVPIAIYAVVMITGIVIMGSNDAFNGLVAAFFFGFPVLTISWWINSFSRWLYKSRRWETIPFIVSNLVIGFDIPLVTLTIVLATTGSDSEVGIVETLLILGSMLGGIVWIIHSIYKRISSSDWKYTSIHMLPLRFEISNISFLRNASPTKSFETMLSHTESFEKMLSHTKSKEKRISEKPKKSIFRAVNIPVDADQSLDIPVPAPTSSDTQKTQKDNPRIQGVDYLSKDDLSRVIDLAYKGFDKKFDSGFKKFDQSYVKPFEQFDQSFRDWNDFDKLYDEAQKVYDNQYDRATKIYDELYDQVQGIYDRFYDEIYENSDMSSNQFDILEKVIMDKFEEQTDLLYEKYDQRLDHIYQEYDKRLDRYNDDEYTPVFQTGDKEKTDSLKLDLSPSSFKQMCADAYADFDKVYENAYVEFDKNIESPFLEFDRTFKKWDDFDELYDQAYEVYDTLYDQAYEIYDELYDQAYEKYDTLYDQAYDAYQDQDGYTKDNEFEQLREIARSKFDEQVEILRSQFNERTSRAHTEFHKRLNRESTQSTVSQHPTDKNKASTQETEKQSDRRTLISKIFSSVSDLTASRSEDIPIPPPNDTSNIGRSNSARDVNTTDKVYRPQPKFRLSFSSPSDDFISEAKKHVNRTEKQCEPVPFMQYWPTYSTMSKAQQKYYFYWRTQLRQGVRLPADTSYLFVYIYEVINLIGFDNPRDAFDHLVKFWGYYRKLVPKLDNYLPDWIADFIVIHKLPTDPLKWYGRIAKMGSLSDEDLLIEAWLQSNDGYDVLSNDIIFRLADYNQTKSKFYKQQADAVDLDNAYKKGIEAVDAYLKAETGKSLFELHQSSRTRALRRRPFASAVHEYPDSEIHIATVHFWYGNEALSDALKNIVKHTENVVREKNGYRYKLRDIELDPKWETAIESAFTVAPAKRELEIDLSEVAQLQEESEAIRERLIVDVSSEVKAKIDIPTINTDATQAESTAARVELDMSEIANIQAESEVLRDKLVIEDDWLEPEDAPLSDDQSQQNATNAGYLVRPDDVPEELLTDLAEVAVIMGDSTGSRSKVIAHMMTNDWQCSAESIQTILDNEFANVIIDEINEAAMDEIGDSLVFEEDDAWVIIEEYRDEIQYILEHPEYQEQVVTQNAPSEIYAELDDEWAEFTDQMEPHYWDALAAILNGEDVETRIDAIAQRHHQTGNILIDAINEISYETIGDILIDTAETPPVVVEDELENMKELLNWAVTRQLIEV